MMNIGKLDKKISLQKCTPSYNETGQQIENWDEVKEVWAAHNPISDGEKWGSGEVKAFVTDRFIVRFCAALALIDATWRVNYDNRVYDIAGVKPIGRKAGFELTATARAERG